MFNLKDREEMLAEFHENVKLNREENCADVEKLDDYMNASDVEMVVAAINKIKNNVVASTPEGVSIPRVSMHTRCSGGEDGISLALISISNIINSAKKFKFSLSVSNNNSAQRVFDFMESVYAQLIVDSMIESNLQRVNAALTRVVQDAGLSYSVKVESPLGNDNKKISFMSDIEICFVADEDRVLNMDDILITHDVDGLITEEMIEEAYRVEAENISEAQTTEQLVAKHGGFLVQYVCDLRSTVRPMTLIKKVCNRNVENMRGNVDCVMYYMKDDVYALIARRDGDLEVILSPFDTKTLRKVDVDVLAGLSA